MKRKGILLSDALCWLLLSNVNALTLSFTSKDIHLLTGQWDGTLTYLDYSTRQPYTVPADVKISYAAKGNLLVFLNTYPNEPKANSSDTVVISADRSMLNSEVVQSRVLLPEGNI